MPSTYTLNNGIELIGTGEQSGTWGDTTNTNLELLDVALDGQVTITAASAGSSGSPNALPITDGSASDGRNRFVNITSGSDLGSTVYYQLTPNDAEKIIYIRNSLNTQDLIVFQGTYNSSNDYVIKNGKSAVIYFNGAGAGAVAANVLSDLQVDALAVDTDTLYVDSTNNRVGIGESSPTAELHITDSAANAVIRLESSTSGESVINFDDTTAGVGQIVYDHSADRMEFGTAANATNTFLDSNQTLIFGADTAQNYPVIGSAVVKGRIQILESDITKASMLGARYTTVTNGFQMTLAHSKSNTIGTQTALAAGDNAGRVLFAGSDGTSFINLAGIEANMESTPSTNTVDGQLEFLTTSGGNTPGVRMKIFSGGRVGLGPTITIPDNFGTLVVTQAGSTSDDGFSVYNTSSGSSMRMYVDGTTPNAERVLTSGSTKMIASDGSTNLKLYTNSGSQLLTLTSGEQAILSSVSTVSYSTGDVPATLQLRENDSSAAISVTRYSASANAPYHILAKSRNATPGNTIVQDGDYLGQIRFAADDGTDLNNIAAEIYARIDGTPGANDTPGELVFATARDGFNSTTDRMKINEGGKVIVGSGAQQRATEIWQTGGGKTDAFFVEGLNSASIPWGGITLTMNNNTSNDFSSTLTFVRTRGSSIGSNAVVVDEDVVGAINFNAADGTDVRSTAASILGEIDGTPGANDTPGKLRFLTAQDGNDYPSQALVISSTQRVIRSTSAAFAGTQYINGGAYFANEGSSAAAGSMQNYRFSSSGNPAYFVIGSSRGTSSGTRTVSNSGDDLGRIVFLGDDGTAFNNTSAYIGVTAAETFTTGSTPGYLRFYTTLSGNINPGERFAIKSDETIVYNNNLRLAINSGNAPGVIRFDDADGAVSSAQVLGKIVGTSDDAQRVGDVAEIQFQYQDSSPDANIIFKTYHNSFATYAERWRIYYNGVLSNDESSGTSSNISLKSGTGITFGAASGTSNMLDYYEEGSWTPVFSNTFLEGAFVNATGFTTSDCRYVKIGRLVKCWAILTSISGTTGDLVGDDNFSFTTASLPFTPSNDGVTFRQASGQLTVYESVGSGVNASGPILFLNANAAVVCQVTAIANSVTASVADYMLEVNFYATS